jgi:hypothetical protein
MPSKPKEPLTRGSDKFKHAKKYIAEGGDINAIKGKYEISAAVEKELTK